MDVVNISVFTLLVAVYLVVEGSDHGLALQQPAILRETEACLYDALFAKGL